MNIDKAKSIPLASILDKIGAKRTLQKPNHDRYLSPWRQERTASFHVNTEINVWYDHGEGIGGNALDFVCEYLKRCGEDYTPADGLRWMRNMTNYIIARAPAKMKTPQPKKLIIEDVTEIDHLQLIRYVKRRGINLDLANIYLKQVQIFNPEKSTRFLALGMKNEDGGWELRNPFFKGCIGPKGISFVRGTIPKPSVIDMSEGIFDFLTVLTVEKKERLNGDFLILHSVSCLNKGLPYIKSYGYRTLRSWLQSDQAGHIAAKRLQEFAATEEGLTVRAMNKQFYPCKDVNAWYMHNKGLKVTL